MKRALVAMLTFTAAPAHSQDWAATCLGAHGQDKVVACTKAVAADRKNLLLRRSLGRALLDVGDGIGAAVEYGAIAAERPDDALAWYEFATALATDYRFAEAAKAIERALTLDPRHFESNKIAVIAFEGAGRAADAYEASLRLAAMGDAIAMYDVAGSLAEGRGIEADPPASVAWFRRAADAGHVGAMAKLARIYGEGLYGQARDPVQAAEWKKRAP